MTPTSGTHKAHYAPSTSLLLSNQPSGRYSHRLFKAQGLTVASLPLVDSETYAHVLYAKLRELDSLGVDI